MLKQIVSQVARQKERDFFSQPAEAKPLRVSLKVNRQKDSKPKSSDSEIRLQIVPKQAILVKDRTESEPREIKIVKKSLHLETHFDKKRGPKLYEQTAAKVKIDFKQTD